jgi:hypothetical protein
VGRVLGTPHRDNIGAGQHISAINTAISGNGLNVGHIVQVLKAGTGTVGPTGGAVVCYGYGSGHSFTVYYATQKSAHGQFPDNVAQCPAAIFLQLGSFFILEKGDFALQEKIRNTEAEYGAEAESYH